MVLQLGGLSGWGQISAENIPETRAPHKRRPPLAKNRGGRTITMSKAGTDLVAAVFGEQGGLPTHPAACLVEDMAVGAGVLHRSMVMRATLGAQLPARGLVRVVAEGVDAVGGKTSGTSSTPTHPGVGNG